MAIPQGTKFHGVAPSVDTVNKGSALANSLRDAYTIDDILAYVSSGLGWARYDDNEYTSSNKLALVDGVTVTIPNNAASVYRSSNDITFYNGSTDRVLADNVNDVYVMTVVFKYQAPNANQTHLDLAFEGTNGTPYDRITGEATFPKGNDVAHNFHQVFQYYADASFVENGSFWQITANGGAASIWDIIYFIQRTQYYGG